MRKLCAYLVWQWMHCHFITMIDCWLCGCYCWVRLMRALQQFGRIIILGRYDCICLRCRRDPCSPKIGWRHRGRRNGAAKVGLSNNRWHIWNQSRLNHTHTHTLRMHNYDSVYFFCSMFILFWFFVVVDVLLIFAVLFQLVWLVTLNSPHSHAIIR